MSLSATTNPTESDELGALHRAGQLASRYPEVPRLLAGLPGDRLLRAGRLLAAVDPADVLRAHPKQATVTVGITGHGTLAPLVPALTAELARHGLLLRPVVTGYDSYVFELGDPDSAVHRAEADLVCCVLDPGIVFDEAPAPWRVEDVRRITEEKLALVQRLVAEFTATNPAGLVLNTVPLTRGLLGELLDHRSRAALGALWREFNAGLLRLVEHHPSVSVLDLDALTTDGVPVTDARLSQYAGARLSAELLAGYAREVGHLARTRSGRAKKCLVLDLDQTLWGGVLGDDGVDGIEVGYGYRGAAFQRFQRLVAQIGAQGVLLAVVSKNELDNVVLALREHPDMVLRENDFVRVLANWRPKHENLAELAADLNIGVDSVVFVDDSPFECGLVRHELPEVAVVQLDDEPALHPGKLLRDGWFDVRELTADDQARSQRYRTDLARKDFRGEFTSIDAYLRELDVRVRLAAVADRDIPRVSQLTLRTNQFNLTTRRLQPADVRALADDLAAAVLTIHSGDRFGDNGLVGAVFTHQDGATTYIDNFLLSCRVFARGIEQACLAAVLEHARSAGATAVIGSYRPTAKNGNFRDFYPSNGFHSLSEQDDVAIYRHDLAEFPGVPDHISLTEELAPWVENAS